MPFSSVFLLVPYVFFNTRWFIMCINMHNLCHIECNEAEKHLFRNWIVPVVGKKPLKDISAFDGERIKKRMRTSEKSDRTIEYTLTVLPAPDHVKDPISGKLNPLGGTC
jgi:hypothetical protein